MQLDILLTAGAIISSVFALPASPTSSQGASDEKGTETGGSEGLLDRPVHPAWVLSAAAAAYLGYRGLRHISSPERQHLNQGLGRRLAEWRRRLDERNERWRQSNELLRQEKRLVKLSNPHSWIRRIGDDVVVEAPNGQRVRVTLREKSHITDCIRAAKYLKIDHQGKFERCLLYARDPTITIEDVLNVDRPLEVPGVQPKGEDTTAGNGNHDRYFSKAIVDQGRRIFGPAAENAKRLLKVMAPSTSVKKDEGGPSAPSGGLQRAPGVRFAPLLR